MHHVAIMKKSWGLLAKILSGEKTVESRWYKFKRPPWDKIKPHDTIWFKNSGEPITLRANITQVLQFNNLNQTKIKVILKKYGRAISGKDYTLPKKLDTYYQNKNYCILIFFNNIKPIKPFHINKTGFGSQAAWVSIPNINQIKLSPTSS